jgi:hypothetical protein
MADQAVVMKLFRLVIMLGLTVMTVGWGAAAHSGEIVEKKWADYSIITERNIFSRQRGRSDALPGTDQGSPRASARPEASYWVLRGISRQGGKYWAFMEDQRSGRMAKAAAGDAIAAGRIERLTLDRVHFAGAGGTISVAIGQTLEGGGASPASEATGFSMPRAATGSTAQPAKGSAPAGADDLIQRLKARRQQQLKD